MVLSKSDLTVRAVSEKKGGVEQHFAVSFPPRDGNNEPWIEP